MIVIVGPSGIGKTTWAERLVRQRPTELCLVPTATTRSPRPDEVAGKDYFFLTNDQFNTVLANEGRFDEALCAVTEFDDDHYGVPVGSLDTVVRLGICPVLVLTPDGAEEFADSEDFDGLLSPTCVCLLPGDDLLLANRRLRRMERDNLITVKDRKDPHKTLKYTSVANYIITIERDDWSQFAELLKVADDHLRKIK